MLPNEVPKALSDIGLAFAELIADRDSIQAEVTRIEQELELTNQNLTESEQARENLQARLDALSGNNQSRRDLLVYGNYEPVSDVHVGALPDVPRTAFGQTGLVTITTANTVIQNKDCACDFEIRAPGVKFINTTHKGSTIVNAGNRGIINAFGNDNHAGLLIKDTTIEPQMPHYYRDGITGNNLRAERVLIRGSNDGIGIFSNPSGNGDCNGFVYGCRVEWLTYWNPDPAHTDGTHNDAVQAQGGAHVRIIGNSLRAEVKDTASQIKNPYGIFGGSAVMLNQNTHPYSDAIVEKNWLYGGYAAVNIGTPAKYPTVVIRVAKNRIHRTIRENYPARSDKRYVCIATRTGHTIDGVTVNPDNVFMDNNAQLTFGRATGYRVLSGEVPAQ